MSVEEKERRRRMRRTGKGMEMIQTRILRSIGGESYRTKVDQSMRFESWRTRATRILLVDPDRKM
eukprot:747515-Hanusia_phi.AAC.1